MKLNKFFMGVLGVFALTACSSEEMIPDKPGPEIDEGLSRYMAITIKNADSNTRAGGDQSGNLFEEGLSPENKVERIRFYFFDKDNKGRGVKADGSNFIDVEANDDSVVKDEEGNQITQMPNVEKILTAVIAISTAAGDNVESLKSIVAIVNGTNLPGDNEHKLVDLETLRSKIGDYSLNADNKNQAYNKDSKMPLFLMTSSVYGSGKYECEVEVKPTDLKSTPEDALESPVDVYVERVLAKVRLTTKWNNDMTVFNNVSYGGKAGYVAVKLKNKDNEAYKTADGKDMFVIFTGWGLQTISNMSYMFKKVNSAWSFPDWNWTEPNKYRSFWALNPTEDGAGNKFELLNFTHSQATTGKIGTIVNNTSAGVTSMYDGDFFYCQENAGDDETTGYKILTNLDETLSNRTQAYIGGVLVTLDNLSDGATATAVDIAEWGGGKYEKSRLLEVMLSAVNDQIYTRTEDGTEETKDENGNTIITTKWKYSSITLDDIKLVEEENTVGITSSSSVNVIQNGKRYISRIQLKKDLNKEWYDASGNKYENDEAVNHILKTAGTARVWGGGTTYYFVDLNHLGTTSKRENDKGEVTEKGNYGVVRNHIYEVVINSVYGLGTPILTPKGGEGEEVIIKPEKPGDDESFLGVRMYILSWRVVNNDTSLDW